MRPRKPKNGQVKVKCTVGFAKATTRAITARLSRGGRTYARTHRTLRAGLASFTLGTSRSLPPGRTR